MPQIGRKQQLLFLNRIDQQQQLQHKNWTACHLVRYLLMTAAYQPTTNSTAPYQQDSPSADNYQQILPGVPQGSLYPTLAAVNAEQSNVAPTVIHTLRNRVITKMDKYMQEAEKA